MGAINKSVLIGYELAFTIGTDNIWLNRLGGGINFIRTRANNKQIVNTADTAMALVKPGEKLEEYIPEPMMNQTTRKDLETSAIRFCAVFNLSKADFCKEK